MVRLIFIAAVQALTGIPLMGLGAGGIVGIHVGTIRTVAAGTGSEAKTGRVGVNAGTGDRVDGGVGTRESAAADDSPPDLAPWQPASNPSRHPVHRHRTDKAESRMQPIS